VTLKEPYLVKEAKRLQK